MTRDDRAVYNEITGEHVRFQLTANDTGGEILVLEDHWTRPGHVVPRHIHPNMEERWTVIQGKVAYTVGDEEILAGPGDSVIAPAGTPHWARAMSNEDVIVRVVMRPACRWEEFVRQLFALAGEDLDGDIAARSIQELLTEFAPEIELAPEETA